MAGAEQALLPARRRLGLWIHAVLLSFAGLRNFGPVAAGFSLYSVQHRPTYGPDMKNGKPKDVPPTEVKQKALKKEGFDPVYDTVLNFSKRTHVGCYAADFAITEHTAQGYNQDPNECYEMCAKKWPKAKSYQILVAIHAEKCGCVLGDMTEFSEVDSRKCTFYCKTYQNPICGGPPNYWGVFREYDYQSLTAHGAYDPWRYIWYTLVVITEKNLRGGFSPPDGVAPERYYLHAVDIYTGLAQYQYQIPIAGILYGIQYDIDSTRLVALHTKYAVGRMRDDMDWQYKMAIIDINTTYETKPELQMSLAPLSQMEANSSYYNAISGASTIFSVKGKDCFVFTQAAHAPMKKDMKDRVYIVRIPDGFVINTQYGELDFKILQLFSNEKYGDLTAIGPRFAYGASESAQTYVYLARIYKDFVQDRTIVDWRYSYVTPEVLTVSTDVTKDLQLYPGVSASEHLFNRSGIVFGFTPPGHLDKRAITILDVNIRNKRTEMWCNETAGCIGTLNYQVPYAGVYNREPGIPLSLKSPVLSLARFTMEAGTILVDFDRATLKGALQVDTNSDFIPDYIDQTKAPIGEFDCGEVFDDKTVLLLGPYDENGTSSTSCVWMTDSRIQINLPPVINISVGDSLFLKPDKIYALPKDGEYSPSSGGGVQVDQPDPCDPPVIVLSGATSVDECSPVELVARDSFNVGGLPSYNWTFVPPTEGAPNPNDLTNDPFRTFNQTKLQGIKDMLVEATKDNTATLTMASNLLEPAATYKFMLIVTSRWKKNTTKEVLLTKLSYAAPMVSINGPAVLDKKRPDRISLQAVGTPSKCSGAEVKLGYRWKVESGNLNWADHPQIVTTTSVLVVPPMVLAPPVQPTDPPVTFTTYNFTVGCYVDSVIGDVPERTAFATVTVRITASQISVVFRTESRKLTRGDILVLDARESQDPDYPTVSGQTFKGNFAWKCLTPDRVPCYATPYGQVADGTIYTVQRCRQDIGRKIQDGGVSFNAPLFDGSPYCEHSRGVMMFQTNNYTKGEWKFALTLSTFAGDRSATGEVLIEITEQRVPKIILDIRERKQKYPITREIRIFGTEEGQRSNETKTFSWKVFVYLLRWDPNVAADQSNDPNNPYLQDQYEFVDKTDVFDPTDPARFTADPNTPTLKIHAGVLQSSNTYKFRMIITLQPSGATGYSDISLTTAGLPPRSGRLEATPVNATMDTPRKFQAIDWTADNFPLEYQWGYIKNDDIGSKIAWSTDAMLVTEFTQQNLVQGNPDLNYTLFVYCDIATPFGVTTTKRIAIQSLPPKNVTTAVDNILSASANADPADVTGFLDAALSADPKNPEVQKKVLDAYNNAADDVPVTPNQLTKSAALLSDLVDNGDTSDAVLNSLEGLVIKTADSGNFKANPNDPGGNIGALAMRALGGLLPGAQNTGSSGGRRLLSDGRQLMTKYRNINDDFTHREAHEMPRGGYLAQDDGDLFPLEAGLGRQTVNHPPPDVDSVIVMECFTAFCDMPSLVCFHTDVHGSSTVHVCCDSANPDTLCNDPPCWFRGQACPDAAPAVTVNTRSSLPWRQDADGKEDSEQVDGRRLVAGPESQTDDDSSENWFDQWNAYNFPLGKADENAMSDWDRTSAYYGWHPNVYKRKLMFAQVDPSKTPGEMLQAMEEDENKEIQTVREMVRLTALNKTTTLKQDAQQEIAFSMVDPAFANLMKANAENNRIAQMNWKMEYDRNNSQRITRIAVMRDTIAKAIITQISTGETKTFQSVSFRLQLGKTTNLSRIHPGFVFPKAFQVPSDSPDFPTPTNPVTGFAFNFVTYYQNVYSWSDSNPDSTQSKLVTLIALKASTDDLFIKDYTKEPVRVYTDLILFANALCLYWDRFAKNTAGGAWSTQGVSNDGTACITTNLSDVGMFMDGRMTDGSMLIDAAKDWEREIWQATCIGCGDSRNFFVIAVLGMVIFTDILLILMGYVLDETRRGDMQKQKLNSRYFYDGDGLTGPMNVDDAIAYQFSDKLALLWMFTTWKVLKREHALLSPAFYHETFTRPQRLLCFGAMTLGLLAMNAVVQSRRGYLIHPSGMQEYVMSGVLSGLLTFPIYCGLVTMFNMRPMPVKKRLIKRTYNPREVDLIAQKRRELDHTSNLMPPPGYLQLPPPPPGGIPHPPGGAALLGTAPALPLPPLPPMAPGGASHMPALPPPPPGMGGLAGTGVAIPALPALTPAGGATMALPPPPRYPPAPKNGKAPSVQMLLPPMQFPRGQPPMPQIAQYQNTHPVPASMIPNSPYVVQGGMSNLTAIDNGPQGDIGGTASRLPIENNAVRDSTGTGPSPGTPPAALAPLAAAADAEHPLAVEEAPSNAPVLQKDGQHSMGPGSNESVSEGDNDLNNDLANPAGNAGVTLRTPRGSYLEVPADFQVRTAFVRGEPNQALPPPDVRGPASLGGAGLPGLPPPGMMMPPGMPPSFRPPTMLPPPPPPPKEDDQAFVRRIRLTYMDKVIKEHEKHDLLEDHDELGKEIQPWVFSMMTLMPYLASCTFICSCIFVVLAYGTKFLDPQAERWVFGSVIGLAMNLGLLDIFRVIMMTLVELRKFENRKKSKAGHFLPRRVKREDDKNFQEAPKPRLWKNSVAAPSVPKHGHKAQPLQRAPSSRQTIDLPPPMPAGPGPNAPLRPPGVPGIPGLPVAPPPPPPKNGNRGPSPRDFANTFSQSGSARGIEPMQRGFDTGPRTPPGSLGGTGQFSNTPPPPQGGLATPEATMTSSMTASLSAQVKANASGRAPPPAPVARTGTTPPGSRPASGGSRTAPPGPPAGQPPAYNRPKSRPSSATSASKATPGTPPGRPPAAAAAPV